MPAARTRMRRMAALSAYVNAHGENGLRALGGRREAERLVAQLDPEGTVPELLADLEGRTPDAG
jgi:hypothetical protein